MKTIKYTVWWAYKKKSQTIENTLSHMDLYNKTIFSEQKNIDESCLEAAAKHAHENGLAYYVTIFENVTPYCFLEINKKFFRVNFLDQHLRLYMTYDFIGKDEMFEWRLDYGDKLFLEQITFWEYKSDTDDVFKIWNYIFKPDGTFVTIERNQITNEQIDLEAKDKIDVSTNWEAYPLFGEYEALIRKERK